LEGKKVKSMQGALLEAPFNPDFAIGSCKQRNLVHQGGEGTESGKNMELRNSGKEVMNDCGFCLIAWP
jgi:hypothetical protein